jgi:Uncharacterized conserved protein
MNKRVDDACVWCAGIFLLLLALTVLAQERQLERSMQANSVQITWEFAAPPRDVWAVWTTPEGILQWFCSDPKGQVLKAELDVRVGGRFEVTFADSDGTSHTASGIYQHVEPHKKLEFSWGWKSEPGVETQIKIEFEPNGEDTIMQFEHGGLVHASSHDYQSGWRSTFQKIDKFLAKK